MSDDPQSGAEVTLADRSLDRLDTLAGEAGGALTSPLERGVSFNAVHRALFGAEKRSSSEARLGGYRLDRKLGAGGMGEVFAATELVTGDRVALKVLARVTATLLYRFKREFRVLADIPHENLVGLGSLDVEASGRAFFTMELVEGEGFVAWVRGPLESGEPPDPACLARLEGALRQLVLGVAHLHAHGFVHRDLKPSNILVTAAGRVVILDFGLVTAGDTLGGVTRDGQTLGTPAYMAPEQASGRGVGTPVDFYAIGGIVYHCLTGTSPPRALERVARARRRGAAEREEPALELPGVPVCLRGLCLDLLSTEAGARPDAATVLRRLPGGVEAHQNRLGPRSLESPRPMFIGRERELELLDRALARVEAQGAPELMVLSGPRGMGKTALGRCFRARVRERGGLVLHGRCREREALPYKGVDALIDALFAHLGQLPRHALEDLRPSDVEALARLFPIMDRLWRRGGSSGELGREIGWEALREVFVGLCGAGPTVIHIDDFHWADADSIGLLEHLLRGPGAPSMLLLVATNSGAPRPAAQGAEDPGGTSVEQAASARLFAGARRLDLAPLAAPDARCLALSLFENVDLPALEGLGVRPARVDSVVVQARGRPSSIVALVFAGAAAEPRDQAGESDSVAVQSSALAAPDLGALQILAVAGGPLPLDFLSTFSPGSDDDLSAALCGAKLAIVGPRGCQSRRGEDTPIPWIEVSRDQVRSEILAGLDAETKARLHTLLGAEAQARLETNTAPDALFRVVDHLVASLEVAGPMDSRAQEQRATLFLRAGAEARRRGAVAVAARYLGHAYETLGGDRVDLPSDLRPGPLEIEVALARAEATAINSPEAGDRAFEVLRAWALEPCDQTRVEVARLAQLCVQGRWGACLERGLGVLSELGLRVSVHPSPAVAKLISGRVSRSLRGWEPSPLSQPATSLLRAQLDILAVLLRAVPVVDLPLATSLSARYLQLCRRCGDHPELPVGLGALAQCVAAWGGEPELVSALSERALAVSASRSGLIEAHVRHLTIDVLGPGHRPFAALGLEGACGSSGTSVRDPGGWPGATGSALIRAALSLESGAPLPTILEALEHEPQGSGVGEPARLLDHTKIALRALIRGPDPASPIALDLDALGGRREISVAARHGVGLMQLTHAVLFADYGLGWTIAEAEAGVHARRSATTWTTPRYTVLLAILLAERWRSGARTASARRRLQRRMRRCALVSRHWAQRCPENFSVHARVIAGELAGLQGREEQAIADFQRAGAIAAEQGLLHMEALAAERLARCARRGGRSIVAREAAGAAVSAYRRWGASAVAQRVYESLGAGAKS